MDAELTPLGNVAFNGAVAEEINRLMRQIRLMGASGNEMSEVIRVSVPCQCRRDWLCHRCEMLNRWKEVSRD